MPSLAPHPDFNILHTAVTDYVPYVGVDSSFTLRVLNRSVEFADFYNKRCKSETGSALASLTMEFQTYGSFKDTGLNFGFVPSGSTVTGSPMPTTVRKSPDFDYYVYDIPLNPPADFEQRVDVVFPTGSSLPLSFSKFPMSGGTFSAHVLGSSVIYSHRVSKPRNASPHYIYVCANGFTASHTPSPVSTSISHDLYYSKKPALTFSVSVSPSSLNLVTGGPPVIDSVHLRPSRLEGMPVTMQSTITWSDGVTRPLKLRIPSISDQWHDVGSSTGVHIFGGVYSSTTQRQLDIMTPTLAPGVYTGTLSLNFAYQ